MNYESNLEFIDFTFKTMLEKRKGAIYVLKFICLSILIFVLFQLHMLKIQLQQPSNSDERAPTYRSHGRGINSRHECRKRILWFAPPVFVINRPEAMLSGFKGCTFSNCKMSYLMSEAAKSDAIIFTGRMIPQKLTFTRPRGQIWIFSEHEPPYRYDELNNRWNQSDVFNWTMTYDNSVSDIHLPYGQIMSKSSISNVNFYEILHRKNKTALIIMSHCDTPADRLQHIEELKKVIDVDVFGKCGDEWNCGQRFLHDDCFSIINEYRFYLAFENSFCNNYFTEKVFENFDYDTVLVIRGGRDGQDKRFLPEGTFISTHDFKNAGELGRHLRTMTDEAYVNILKRKQQFTSINSYKMGFQKAMCNICYRMNNLNKFQKSIKDMNHWAYSSAPCVPPNDLQ